MTLPTFVRPDLLRIQALLDLTHMFEEARVPQDGDRRSRPIDEHVSMCFRGVMTCNLALVFHRRAEGSKDCGVVSFNSVEYQWYVEIIKPLSLVSRSKRNKRACHKRSLAASSCT